MQKKTRLRFRYKGKVLNQRVLFQYLIPKLINFKKKRKDISVISEYYSKDWDKVLKDIEKIRTSG